MSPISLRESLKNLRSGKITATELTIEALDAALDSQKQFNAFSIVAREQALKAAKESDMRYAAGEQRRLDGLPIAIKDLIDTKDLETRYGSPAFLGNLPTEDAEIVRALTDQGAIVVGKTTTHEFAWGVTTSSMTFGDTRNHLDPARIPGGSSGGAAVAIGYGAVAAGLGTDTGGSVRIPAALCGVVGYKPTKSTFSLKGIFPLAPSLDHPGILGATVDDVMLLAEALGVQPIDCAGNLARVGLIRAIPPVPVAFEVSQAFEGAITKLKNAVVIQEFDSSSIFDGVFQAFAGIVLIEGGITHFRLNSWERISRTYECETVDRLDRARTMVLGDYSMWQDARRRFTEALTEAMESFDYLVLPTCPCTAPRLNENAVKINEWTGTIREALMSYTAPFNVAGFPAISLPIVAHDAALPAALQIVGKPGSDGALLQIAQRFETLINGR